LAGSRTTHTERSLQGRQACLTGWANTRDPSARTAPGRAAMFKKYLDQIPEVDEQTGEVIPDDERRRRAEYLRRAHLADLARRAAKKRRLASEASR
jgi:hypothetical protein